VAPRTPRRVGRARVAGAECDRHAAFADLTTFDPEVAEAREALDVFGDAAELRLAARRVLKTINGAAVRGRDVRLSTFTGDGDDLLFRHGGKKGNVSVLHRIDAALWPGGQKDGAVRAAADRVNHLVLELARGLDETVGIDFVDLAAAGLRCGRGIVEREADFD